MWLMTSDGSMWQVLRYIVEASREGHLPGRGSDTLVTKILESNPILEAFGKSGPRGFRYAAELSTPQVTSQRH